MEERYDIKFEDIVGWLMNEFLENIILEKVLNSKVGMSDLYFIDKKENMYVLVYVNFIFYKEEFIGVVCIEVKILVFEFEKVNDILKYLKNEVKNLFKGSFDKILGKSYKLEKLKVIVK